ncbi:MAG TPA: type 1 glutamine amidotransferase domain-containing protein [Anaerolineaceae bacterium]|nr:type 1 glutamine amidotransferase domain-containing protein [Anaerolineaceae bacterium]
MTQQKPLSGKKVAMLVTDAFEQVELTSPRDALIEAGAEVKIISNKPGQVQGFKGKEKADSFKVDLTFEQADPDDFDALMLPGGAYNADKIRMVKEAQQWVQTFDRANKPMAVICHAPWLLISAGVAKGRRLTSYYTLQDDLRNAGATWTDEPMVRDRNLVTSRNPDDLPQFNRAMVDLFQEAAVGEKQAARRG